MNNHPNAPTHGSKPFLKWVGGKQRLLTQLLPLLPPGARLIEPFVGAGAVFLGSSYPRYLINDANPDLVAVWTALKQRPREFIERSSVYFSEQYLGQDAYLQVRKEFNAEIDRFERAVRLIYLNKTGFNGLFRVNRSGAFNVPYGQPKTLPWFPAEELANASQKMANVTVMGGDFSAAIAEAGGGEMSCTATLHICRIQRAKPALVAIRSAALASKSTPGWCSHVSMLVRVVRLF